MPDQTDTIHSQNQVLNSLTLSGSPQSYQVNTVDTHPDYIVRVTATQDWQFGSSLSGPWTPIPANTPLFIRITHDPTTFYAQGPSGTLSPMVSSSSGGSGSITAPAVLNGGSVTADTPPLTVEQTRNNGSIAFRTIVVELTDTAVDPAASWLKVLVGGSPVAFGYDSGTFGVTGILSGGGGVYSGANVYMDNFPGFVQWVDLNFNSPTLGTSDGNSLALVGTDPSGNPVPIWSFALADATPTFAFSVPVLGPTFTVSHEVVFEDQDGRDPNWEMFANAGNWVLKADATGDSVLTVQPNGAVGLVGDLTITETLPTILLNATGGGKEWRLQADGSGNLNLTDLTDSVSVASFSETEATFDVPVSAPSFPGFVEQLPGLIEAPIAKTYIVILATGMALTVAQIAIATVSGTCTVDVQINGVGVTGLTGIAVTSTPQTLTATALNTMSINDKLTLVVSSPSTPADLAFVIQTTR